MRHGLREICRHGGVSGGGAGTAGARSVAQPPFGLEAGVAGDSHRRAVAALLPPLPRPRGVACHDKLPLIGPLPSQCEHNLHRGSAVPSNLNWVTMTTEHASRGGKTKWNNFTGAVFTPRLGRSQSTAPIRAFAKLRSADGPVPGKKRPTLTRSLWKPTDSARQGRVGPATRPPTFK